jgi:hypothetical protein
LNRSRRSAEGDAAARHDHVHPCRPPMSVERHERFTPMR